MKQVNVFIVIRQKTIEHVLIKCKKYEKERFKLIKEVRNIDVESFNLTSLLKKHAEQGKIYGAIIKYITEIGLIRRM